MRRQKDDMTLGAVGHMNESWDEDMGLVRRFLAGDHGAFDKIYNRYYEKVFVIARGILIDVDDASDATQECFQKIYSNLNRFDGRSRLSTWIFRIAVNSAIQVSRRLKYRRRHQPLSEASDLEVETDTPTTPHFERLQEAMVSLRPEDRAILTLFYWENLSITQISETLGCRENAAKTRLYRARERLKRAFVGEDV
jgi:RNA polymerase sigma-70 factor (ECF subfamily)